MPKIHAPNKQYTGFSASVAFANGVGETDDPHLLTWFENHGYEIEKVEPPADGHKFGEMTIEELTAFADENSIDLGKSTSHDGILKKILEAATKTE